MLCFLCPGNDLGVGWGRWGRFGDKAEIEIKGRICGEEGTALLSLGNPPQQRGSPSERVFEEVRGGI